VRVIANVRCHEQPLRIGNRFVSLSWSGSFGTRYCKLPPLTRQEILAIVKKHVADLDKWEVRISEHNCSYRIDGDCCPDQRGTHWSLLISRDGTLLERFQGR
jgi:hypothetical protein